MPTSSRTSIRWNTPTGGGIDRKWTVEVGGQSKDGKQIAGVTNAFIASDDIEYALGNKIPLWLFGFLDTLLFA